MITRSESIDVGGVTIEVVRKEIRNLHVGVYPPHGRVRVAAPVRLDHEAVRLALVSRLGWIRRKQKEFEEQVRQSKRELLTGESHYFQGRRYRLDVIAEDRSPSIHLTGHRTMQLRVRPGSDCHARDVVLQRWYRKRLREQIPPLLAKWEPMVGETVADVRIKRMKTLWGSCNAADRRIWLNLELAKKPVSCLEYILVHEMVHLIERHHTDRFRETMNQLLPQWRRNRDELNRAPLSHEDWESSP